MPPSSRYQRTPRYDHRIGLDHVFARASRAASQVIGRRVYHRAVAAVLLALALGVPPAPAQAQNLAPIAKQQFFTNAGVICAACKLYTYAAGTTTPLATYTDSALGTPNANPIVLDSAGRATIYLSTANYKFVLKDPADATIWTQDNVASPGANVALLNATNIFIGSGTTQFDPGSNADVGFGLFIASAEAGKLVTQSAAGASYSGGEAGRLVLRSAGRNFILGTTDAKYLMFGTNNLERWGISSAGHWTFGASAHIADAVTAPTISSGLGTSPTIAGTVYAFTITIGTGGSTGGVVAFNTTFSSAPACTVTSDYTTPVATAAGTTTTQVTLTFSASVPAANKVHVLCRGY